MIGSIDAPFFIQTGEEAVKAHNVFHPLTYAGAIDIKSIEDPVTQAATIAQILSYGQTPQQLFTKPVQEKVSSWPF